MWSMIEEVEFGKEKTGFQKTLQKKVNQIKTSNEVFVCADKTRNIYKTDSDHYNKLKHENITQKYKKVDAEKPAQVNREAKKIAKELTRRQNRNNT